MLHIGHAPAGRVKGGGVCTHSFSAPQEGRDTLGEGGTRDVTIIVVTPALYTPTGSGLITENNTK